MNRVWCRATTACWFGMALAAVPTAALDIGVRTGVYMDAEESFLGVESLHRMQRSQWYLNPSLEWAALDRGDVFTLAFDVHYDFPNSGQFDAWLGGGPAVVHREIPGLDSDTELGLGLLAGLGFNPQGAVRPYLQFKLLLADDTEAAVALGFRFF